MLQLIEEHLLLQELSLLQVNREIASNNAKSISVCVYIRTYSPERIYDRGDNLVDTYVGWGTTGTTPFKAGVRFTAASEIKLAGVDFIYRTEDLIPGEITVQVRAAGTTTTAPGAVLYTAIFNTAAYFSSTGDYIHLPFGNDAPIIASGSDYWITVKVPLRCRLSWWRSNWYWYYIRKKLL